MTKRWAVNYVFFVGAVSLLTGCAKKENKNPKPHSSPTPPPISAVITKPSLSVYDSKTGQTVLTMKAQAAGGSPNNDTNTVMLQQGNVVLYQKGVAEATITADTLTANREARTVVATGNVVAHSLTQKGTPTIRADKMVWNHDTNILTGSGNVVMTAKPAYTIPARSFTADTQMSHVRVQMGNAPATGAF